MNKNETEAINSKAWSQKNIEKPMLQHNYIGQKQSISTHNQDTNKQLNSPQN